MRKPIDRFSGKNADEIYEKENLLDEDNLEKDDKQQNLVFQCFRSISVFQSSRLF